MNKYEEKLKDGSEGKGRRPEPNVSLGKTIGFRNADSGFIS